MRTLQGSRISEALDGEHGGGAVEAMGAVDAGVALGLSGQRLRCIPWILGLWPIRTTLCASSGVSLVRAISSPGEAS